MTEHKKELVSVTVKLTPTDVAQATAIFDDLGLDLTTAIKLFIQKSIAAGGLPFEVKDPFDSPANQDELTRRFKKVANHQGCQPHQLLDDGDGV